MKNIKYFKEFKINESSAAGNRDETFDLPFSYSSNNPKFGYTSKSFVEDLESIFVEKPEIKKEITEFLLHNMDISSIKDLEKKPISLIKAIIPEIERIIAAADYEPEVVMPGGSLLFIRNKALKNGRGADFYVNRKGTKIEVVTEDENGEEKVYMYDSKTFPFDFFEFTEEEKEELKSILKAKGA